MHGEGGTWRRKRRRLGFGPQGMSPLAQTLPPAMGLEEEETASASAAKVQVIEATPAEERFNVGSSEAALAPGQRRAGGGAR